MKMAVTFLGTGTSTGVPMIGCDCAVCRSADPRDRRLRTSTLVSLDGGNILIDVTPEFRLQCLANQVRRLEAILLTHGHADHILGLDDVRRLNQLQGEPIDVYASPRTLETLEKIFPYARADRVDATLELPRLWYKPITGPFTLLGQDIIPCDLPHGGATSLGFRLGPLGYCTDFHAMADEVVERLRGVRVMILGALRPTPHATHLSFRQAVDLARRIGAPRTYFVHLSHHVRHADQREHLPEGIEFAHDGLKITI